MYNLYVYTSSVSPQSYSDRYYGHSVRCILQAPTHTVTVSMDSNINSVSFSLGDQNNVAQTATKNNPTVTLAHGASYLVTADVTLSYRVDNWSTTANGTLGSTTVNPTTYSVLGDATLTVTSQLTCDTPVPGVTYMQNITNSNKTTILANMTLEFPYYIIDSRDNEKYCVARLADGNLWLLDNLRLDLTDPAVEANVTPSTTNATQNSLNYLFNGGGAISDKYAITNVKEWTSSSKYASSYSYSDPLIATGGSCANSTSCVDDPTSGQWNQDATATPTSLSGNG